MHFLTEPFLFFALAFGAAFFLLGRDGQKWLLLAGSIFFVGSQNWLFAGLLGSSIIVNYLASLTIDVESGGRSRGLWCGVIANVLFLGVFKYFKFFSTSLSEGLGFAGIHYSPAILSIVLPLGISFYTLQAISYLVDLREGKIARAGALDLAVYLSFWPKFVAGPIIRATRFLPQLKSRRTFRWANFYLGLESVIYGLFLKTVLSDYLAPQVNRVYAAPDAHDGASSLLAVLFFTLQIYGDFAGYSLVVVGISRILGFSVAQNFRRPNFARSFSEFWGRWHISLSSWLEDYVFRRLPTASAATNWSAASVAEIYTDVFQGVRVQAIDSFSSLSGDSLSFVQVSMALEAYLGSLPRDWEHLSIEELEALKHGLAHA